MTWTRLPALRHLCRLCAALLLGAYTESAAAAPSCRNLQSAFQVSFLHVGLGDAILVTCPDGKEQLLIDGGDSNNQYPGAEALLRGALGERLRGDTHVETVVATHPHPDHVAGLAVLAKDPRYSFGRYFDLDADFAEASWEEEARKSFASRGAAVSTISSMSESPRSLDICRADAARVTASFLPLTKDQAQQLSCPGNLNDCSLKLLLTMDSVRILLLADATTEWEASALASPAVRPFLKAHVMKAGHHASQYSTSPEFIRAVAPKAVMVTAGVPGKGRVDSLGYPSRNTLAVIADYFAAQGILPQEAMPGCLREGSHCSWKEVPVPRMVFSTAMESVDLYISGKSVCISHGSREYSFTAHD